MRILGIDPGLTCTGFGVVDSEGAALHYVASGTIRTSPGDGVLLPHRLKILFDGIGEVVQRLGGLSGVLAPIPVVPICWRGCTARYFALGIRQQAKNSRSGIRPIFARLWRSSFHRGIRKGARCIFGSFGLGLINGSVAISTDDWVGYLSGCSSFSVAKIGHFS